MDQHTTYLLQMLETLGAPLMSAVMAAQPHDQAIDLQSEAQSLAALLGKTVETSIELGTVMDVNPAEAQDDTLRVALAGLAAPLVAGQYARRHQIPESADLKKITGALQAVLTFSDNFTPTAQTVERLKNLEAQGQIVDSYQTQIQYMQAFIPVIEAIAAFSFGQAEAKLIMDVSTRLVKRAVQLRETLLPGIDDEAVQKRTELGFLNALATLYSACHKAETGKVLNMDETARAGGLTMEPVWTAFDTRAAMLEALAARIAGSVASQGGGQSGGQSPALSQAAPPDTPPASGGVQQPAVPLASPPPPPSDSQTPTAPPSGGHNPMAMFAAPKDDAGAAPAPQTQVPAAPPDSPPAAVPQDPPAQPVAAPPPVQETPTAASPPAQPAKNDQNNQDENGSPMSFFKKKEE